MSRVMGQLRSLPQASLHHRSSVQPRWSPPLRVFGGPCRTGVSLSLPPPPTQTSVLTHFSLRLAVEGQVEGGGKAKWGTLG